MDVAAAAAAFVVTQHVYDATHNLALDLYVPQPALETPPPLILFIHGGAWVDRDKNSFTNIGRCFATKHRLAAAVIDYRLSPKQKSTEIHPMHTRDCAAALQWLHKNAASRYNPQQIFLLGHSAGGFMAGLLAIHPPYLSEFGSAIENGVKGYVGVQGIYDLVELDKSFPDYRQYFIEFAFGDSPAAWLEASPAHTPFNSSSCHAPWLVVHSREDELVDLKQANLWLSYLNANKIAAELAIGIWGLHWDGMTAIGSDKDPISPLVAAFVTRALSH